MFRAACSKIAPVWLQSPVTPLIIELTEPATEEITVGDVLVGVFSFTGAIVVVAIVLAVAFAGALIGLRRARPDNPLNGDDSTGTRLGLHLPS